jgi:hypothetical protein
LKLGGVCANDESANKAAINKNEARAHRATAARNDSPSNNIEFILAMGI